MKIYDYTTSGGKNVIIEYIEKLPPNLQVQVLEARRLIREEGLYAFELLNTRQLYKKLWEIKISSERIMYVIKDNENVYFLHICKKQKGKAEKKNLELAKNRAKNEGLL